MADIQSNINLDIDASGALATLRTLQRQISAFQQTMAKTGAMSNARLGDMQQNLVNSINSTGQFTASIQKVRTTTESFTNALEKNKLSMGQYFRYSMGATKTFGRGFKTEFDTIEKVARERVKTLQTQYIKLGRDGQGAMQAIAVRPQVLDMKDLGTQTAIAAQKAQLFNQLMAQGSTNLLNFGKNTQWAGRQLMVGFTIPLGIMGAAAAKEFKAIEEQVIRLERVYGDFTTTMADTEQMTSQIKDLADEFTKYGVSVAKTIGLAADAAAMGSVGADLVAQVAEANRLAVLGGVQQEQALETTISLTSAFGVAREDLAKKTDFLNAVENQTITSIEDLTTAIPKAGPVVQQLGGNVEDLTFFLTAMREGGINASESANALKSGLASLINPTAEASEMLGGFGINLQGIVEANKGNVKGIVIDFAKALDTLDPLNRAQAIEQLFGKFQFSRLSTLFQNVIKEGGQASRVLELTNSSASELAALSQRELGKVEASPLFQFEGAIERFKAALAPVGEEFMKAVTPLINFGTQILEGFNNMEGGVKQFSIIAVGAIGAIGPVVLMTIGLLMNGLANIVKGVLFVRNGFKGMGDQSNILTNQLNYMNSEQLESAAVSASLNQVHNTLIQTFTAEAGAVRNLAAAYGSAVAAQGAFAGPISTRGGGMKKPKGFASGGIFKGPGSGTSDSIPAMVSNGEAIIPAKNVARFPEMTAGLIAGNIPGFASGKNPVSNAFAALRGAPEAIRQQTQGMQWRTREAEQLALQSFLKRAGLSDTQSGNMMRVSAAHIDPSDAEQVSIGDKQRKVKRWNASNLMADSSAVNQYLERLTSKFGQDVITSFSEPKNIEAMSQKLGATPKAINSEIKKMQGGKHPTTLLGGKVMRELANFDAAGNFGGANYIAGAAGTVLNTRDMEDFYDPKKQKARGYDPSKDASVAASIQKRIQKEQALHGMQDKNIQVATVNAKEENQTQAYKKSRIQAEKKFEEQRSKLNGVEKGKLTKQREQWIAAETLNIEEQRKAAAREKAAIKRQQASPASGKPTLKSRVGGMASRIGGAMSPGRVGMAGMMAGGALSAASMMGGPAGDIAGQIGGPLMAISGIASVLSMIPGPAGLVVGALGGVAAGLFFLNAESEKAKAAARQQAEAVNVTAKAMNSLAEAAGTVNPLLEANQKRTEASFSGTKEATFGESYLASETGAAMLKGVREFASSNGMYEASQKIANQLSTAVSSGILTLDQAKSIALAIGDQLKSTGFNLDVIANISKLLGPNGENLLEKPFELALTLSKESQKDFDKKITELAKPVSSLPGEPISVSGGKRFAGVDPSTISSSEAVTAISEFNSMQMQNQMLLASQDQQNAKVVEQLIAEGKIAEAKEKQLAYDTQRKALLDQITSATASFNNQLDNMNQETRDVLVSESSAQAKSVYAGTDQESVANSAIDTLSKGKADAKAKITLNAEVASGTLTPEQLQTMLKLFKDDEDSINKIAELTAEIGPGTSQQIADILPLFGDDAAAAKTFVAKIEDMDPAESKNMLNTIETIRQYGGEELATIAVNLVGTEDGLAKLTDLQNKYNQIDAMEPITAQAFLETGILGDLDAVVGAEQWFASLPDGQVKTAAKAYITATAQIQANDPAILKEAISRYKAAGGGRVKGIGKNSAGMTIKDYTSQIVGEKALDIAKSVVAQSGDWNNSGVTSTAPPPPRGGGGGGSQEPEKPPTSFLDSLVKDIRDFTRSAQGLTENFVDSMNAIRSATVSAFGGLSQQLRGVGLGEDVISMMTGMSKEDWDQYKGQFFNFDAAGNVTGFKNDLAVIQERLRGVTLGKFVDEQQKSIANASSQALGLSKLVSLGMSYANAYEMVEDAALAAAIANASSAEEIRKIIELANQARQIQSLADASKSVAGTNDATDATLAGLNALIKYNSALSDTQISAILASDELQTMLANFDTLDVSQLEVLNEALQDAANKEALEIQIKMQTPEGMQDLFNEGFGKAMEQFSAREQEIKIKFTALKDPFQDVIKSFSQQIEDMKEAPGGLDDLEADLQRIGEQEIDINKKYDERFKALDSIAKVNERIAAQQRTQLSLSEALSMGDIAAAARVAQEMRATDAAQALVDQREALQKSQELELENLMGNMGMTRAQLEAQIRDIKQQIFEIEEAQIEPAQYQIDLLTRQEELELSSLTILGQTRDEWEAVKNQVELARTSSDSYADDIERADGLVQQLINKWNEVPDQVTTIHTIIEDRITAIQNTPAPAPAQSSAPVASTAPAPAYNPANDPAWVNSMAIRTIRGEFGNGQARRNALGANYDVIQNRVNQHYAGVRLFANGGYVANYMAKGGMTKPMFGPKGTDTVPAMLTPGEFVVKKWAVDKFGVGNLNAINQGNFGSGSVYNYNMSVNVKSDANPDEIARTVMAQIKRVDAQRIRGNRF